MNTLVIPFLIFSLLTFLLGAAFFFWAWRAGQFRQQDRARYLALWAEVPEGNEGNEARTDRSKKC